MEQQILSLIEEEVTRRVNLRLAKAIEDIARTYELPIEQLSKDISKIEDNFCKGILKNHKRCLKVPKENGYCGFHQKQAPQPPPSVSRPLERVKAPWET